jgi:hypothetical protein
MRAVLPNAAAAAAAGLQDDASHNNSARRRGSVSRPPARSRYLLRRCGCCLVARCWTPLGASSSFCGAAADMLLPCLLAAALRLDREHTSRNERTGTDRSFLR